MTDRRKEQNRAHDRRRRLSQPWRAWYPSPRWRAKAHRQLSLHPLCALCQRQGRIVPATACDHVEPHRGDQTKFFEGAVQSLCQSCHSSRKQQQETRGYDAMPNVHGHFDDPNHPFNKPQKR